MPLGGKGRGSLMGRGALVRFLCEVREAQASGLPLPLLLSEVPEVLVADRSWHLLPALHDAPPMVNI